MTLTEKTSSAQRSVLMMMMISMMMTILMTMKMTMTGERAGVVPSLPPRGRSHAL